MIFLSLSIFDLRPFQDFFFTPFPQWHLGSVESRLMSQHWEDSIWSSVSLSVLIISCCAVTHSFWLVLSCFHLWTEIVPCQYSQSKAGWRHRGCVLCCRVLLLQLWQWLSFCWSLRSVQKYVYSSHCSARSPGSMRLSPEHLTQSFSWLDATPTPPLAKYTHLKNKDTNPPCSGSTRLSHNYM